MNQKKIEAIVQEFKAKQQEKLKKLTEEPKKKKKKGASEAKGATSEG